ncbi:MAG: hypothetical protein H6Q90_3369 [Deltaproteobacteria bacterium]|nr:hypothetical protein [Deltaproteobacteria bacterium]
MRRMLVLAVVAACTTPPLKIIYEVAEGTPGQSCGVTECKDIPMGCESVLSVRILSPSNPSEPFVSVCEVVPPSTSKDLCAIGKIDLPPTDLPREVLEVQVTVWPKSMVTDPVTGELNCLRVPVMFDANLGFPIDLSPTPALGGHAFYHPGDSETVVTLGCTNKELINAPSCSGMDTVSVTSTVTDFETGVSVGENLADQLNVFVGEPTLTTFGSETAFTLFPNTARALSRATSVPPVWGADVKLVFTSSACIEVLEDDAPAITSLRCRDRITSADRRIDIAGVRVSKETLREILGALTLAEFPPEGLTLGIVLDANGNPAAGFPVAASQGTVQYLNANRTGLATGGKTTASGMFVSRDAPYGTLFSTFLTTQLSSIGGLVQGRLTIVLFDPPTGQ